jgi:Reverse transcriptase (RNA-dependent DNA polymerase)
LLRWINAFLANRGQQTRVGRKLSNRPKLASGVVQGSVLGSSCFYYILMTVVNVLVDEHCTCKLYADDLTLYSIINSANDLLALQEKINKLNEWSNIWQLKISHKNAVLC